MLGDFEVRDIGCARNAVVSCGWGLEFLVWQLVIDGRTRSDNLYSRCLVCEKMPPFLPSLQQGKNEEVPLILQVMVQVTSLDGCGRSVLEPIGQMKREMCLGYKELFSDSLDLIKGHGFIAEVYLKEHRCRLF